MDQIIGASGDEKARQYLQNKLMGRTQGPIIQRSRFFLWGLAGFATWDINGKGKDVLQLRKWREAG